MSQDRVSRRGAPESRGARSSVRAFVSLRTHLGVGFVQLCSHLRESSCSGEDTDCPPQLSQLWGGLRESEGNRIDIGDGALGTVAGGFVGRQVRALAVPPTHTASVDRDLSGLA